MNNIAYVLDLKGPISLLEGSYAPIGIQTRLSDNVNRELKNKGPVIDTNPVFDMVYVIGVTENMTISAEVNENYIDKTGPGEEFLVDVTFTMP